MIKKLSEEDGKWKDKWDICTMGDTHYIIILITEVTIHILIYIYILEVIGNIFIRIIEVIIHITIGITVVINFKRWKHREIPEKMDTFLIIAIKLRIRIIFTEMAT